MCVIFSKVRFVHVFGTLKKVYTFALDEVSLELFCIFTCVTCFCLSFNIGKRHLFSLEIFEVLHLLMLACTMFIRDGLKVEVSVMLNQLFLDQAVFFARPIQQVTSFVSGFLGFWPFLPPNHALSRCAGSHFPPGRIAAEGGCGTVRGSGDLVS